MTVIKNQKSNTYEVRTYYKDWTGVRKQKTKRGFKRKCDAQEWERAFKLKENLSLDMYFEDFVDLYLNDIKSRIKYNTWLTKKHIVEKKILPYFSKKKLQEIKPSDIRQWQNTMMNYRNKQGEGYSQVYLKTIHNQLSAILNHGRGRFVVLDIEDYERERAEKKLLMKLQEAEEAVKDGEGWLSLDELKAAMGK